MSKKRNSSGIEIPQGVVKTLIAIAKHAQQIQSIVCRGAQTEFHQWENLRDHLLSELGKLDALEDHDVLGNLISLSVLRDDLGLNGDDLFDKLTSSIQEFPEETCPTSEKQAWKDSGSFLKRILSPDSLTSILAKTGKLNSEHQNRLLTNSIVTDVRPVFDDKGEQILRSIIYHSLVLEYTEGDSFFRPGSKKKLHLWVDGKDIDQLMVACERAKKKSSAIKSALNKIVPTQEASSDG